MLPKAAYLPPNIPPIFSFEVDDALLWAGVSQVSATVSLRGIAFSFLPYLVHLGSSVQPSRSTWPGVRDQIQYNSSLT